MKIYIKYRISTYTLNRKGKEELLESNSGRSTITFVSLYTELPVATNRLTSGVFQLFRGLSDDVGCGELWIDTDHYKSGTDNSMSSIDDKLNEGLRMFRDKQIEKIL